MGKKRKILFVVQLPPPVHGASAMNQYVYESKLLRSEFECEALPLQFADSISDIGSFSVKKLWLMMLFSFRLLGKLIRFRPHMVYFTIAPVGSAFIRDAFFSFLIRCFRITRLYHLHGKGIREEASSSALKRFLYRFTFQRSKVIILARSLASDIKDVFSGEVFVLPNGVPKFPNNKARKDASVPTFLYLSNLVRSKGIAIFLEALKGLQDKKVDFKARIVGAPFDMTIGEVQQFISDNGLTAKVEALGPLYGKDKYEALNGSDVLVFPTFYRNEAFPLTILEALQAGLPVIASNNGGISEIIDNGATGFVVPMQDTEETTARMELLAKDEELRKRMSARAKEKFEQSFTIEKFEQRLFDIFKTVLH